MEKTICENCGNEIESINSLVCPKCGYKRSNIEIESDNEIDAVIDSIIDDVLENRNSKIINKNEEQKMVSIDSLDSILYRNNEKCLNCGQCKKICENKVNISYDLNKCKKPICIECGQCVINCPSGALYVKEDYKEVKEIMDANEKLVVAIVSPEVKLMMNNLFGKGENIEYKFVEALKKSGFDYIFDGSFGCDLYIKELAGELVHKINNRRELPIFSSSCPSWIKYAEIYHPEILENISTCKDPLVMHCEAIKKYFSNEKGFDREKIITVGITTCTAKKMESREYDSLDYVLSDKEIIKLFEDLEIKIDSLNEKEYDKLLSEGSIESSLFSFSGGETYSAIKELYKIMANTYYDNKLIFDTLDNNDIKEVKIPVGNYEIRILVVNKMKNLEKVLDSDYYKKFHYIEVMNCNDGCVGSRIELDDLKTKKQLIDTFKEKKSNNVNEELDKLYKVLLIKPFSEESRNLLHTNYSDKSSQLNNK